LELLERLLSGRLGSLQVAPRHLPHPQSAEYKSAAPRSVSGYKSGIEISSLYEAPSSIQELLPRSAGARAEHCGLLGVRVLVGIGARLPARDGAARYGTRGGAWKFPALGRRNSGAPKVAP